MPRDDLEAYPETLPAAWYHDPAIFERERAAIFARHWTLLARADQLATPGAYVGGEIAGRPVFAIRARDGAVKGFHNVCRHRAGPLVRAAAGRCDLLRCGYHGWVYNHEGHLVKAPGFDDGTGFERGQFNLYPIRVALWNGLVFGALDEEAGSFEDWLGDIADIARDFPAIGDLAFAREVVGESAANWKTYGDNSVEGYHLPFVHKDLTQAVGRETVEIAPYARGQFVGFKVTYDDPEAGGRGRGFWIYKFPGLLLHFSATAVNVERVTALGPRAVRLARWFWVPKEKAPGDKIDYEAEIDASAIVMGEDGAICEAVQRNLEAGVYQTGRLSPAAEPGTIYFQQLVRQALEA